MAERGHNGRAARRRSRVVIAGGGVAGLEAALALTALAGDRVEIELIAPEERFAYRPLVVVEPFTSHEPWSHDLALLLAHKGIDLRRDAVVAVDVGGRAVRTRCGDVVSYDVLLAALGARPLEALPGAITFAGRSGVAAMRSLVRELEDGEARSVAFAIPPGVVCSVAPYELALLTRGHLEPLGIHPAIEVVTPEEEPLGIFGPASSGDVRSLLGRHDVGFRSARPSHFRDGALVLSPEGSVEVDRVVALPAYRGPAIEGLPADEHGFIPTGPLGAVTGAEGVFAAGDATDFPVKQGGLAAQQADVAAISIAARLGAPVRPRAFEPVLRGIVVGGDRPLHLHGDLAGHHGESLHARARPFWLPPAKVAGRYLAPFLAAHGAPLIPSL